MGVYIGTTELKAAYIGENPTWKPNEHTVAYRPLTETTTQYDQSGNNYNLTKTDGSFTTLGDVSCFYNGGSTTGYLNRGSTSPKIPYGSADRTISLWARANAAAPSYRRGILSYGENSSGKLISIRQGTAGVFQAYFNGTTLAQEGLITANTWYSIALVVSSGSQYLYINGEKVASANASINTTAISSSYPLRLMRDSYSTSSNYQFRGYLSEVIIEDKAWTATEMVNYFNDNKAKYGLS